MTGQTHAQLPPDHRLHRRREWLGGITGPAHPPLGALPGDEAMLGLAPLAEPLTPARAARHDAAMDALVARAAAKRAVPAPTRKWPNDAHPRAGANPTRDTGEPQPPVAAEGYPAHRAHPGRPSTARGVTRNRGAR